MTFVHTFFLHLQQSVPPVMAFYWGSLGFLAPFQFKDFRNEVVQVLEGMTVALRSCYFLETYSAQSGAFCFFL